MYKLLFSEKALRSMKTIPKTDSKRILEKLENLAADPGDSGNVKKLRNHPLAIYRLRVGNYRVLFDKHDELRILEVIDINHRKSIYK